MTPPAAAHAAARRRLPPLLSSLTARLGQRQLFLRLLLLAAALILGYVYVGALRMAEAQRTIAHEMRVLDALLPLLPSASAVLGSTPIFYINMASSTSRRARFEESAARTGLRQQIHRIEGFNPKDVVSERGGERITLRADLKVCTPDDICVTVPRSYSGTFTMGELGCLMSHLLAMRKALTMGLELVLVAEDDVILEPISLWPETLEQLLGRAPAGWGVVNLMPTPPRMEVDPTTDVPLLVPPRDANGQIPPPVAGFDDHLHTSATFYAVRRSGMEALWGTQPARHIVLRERLWRLVSDIHLWSVIPTYHFMDYPTVMIPNVGAATDSVINGRPSRRWARTSAAISTTVARTAVATARRSLAALPRGVPRCIHRYGVNETAAHAPECHGLQKRCSADAPWTWVKCRPAAHTAHATAGAGGSEARALSSLDQHGGAVARSLQAVNVLRASGLEGQAHFAVVLPPSPQEPWALVAATAAHPLLQAVARYRYGPVADLDAPMGFVDTLNALLDMTSREPAPGVLVCRANGDCRLGATP